MLLYIGTDLTAHPIHTACGGGLTVKTIIDNLYSVYDPQIGVCHAVSVV